MRSYNYNPALITAKGKDQMRFELGDTMVEGKEMTCALCDEEYTAIIPARIHTKRQWKKAKLACIESIFRRFAYEADTKDGNLSLSLGDRAALWKKMYDELKAELDVGAADPESILKLSENPVFGKPTRPYFWAGMMAHEEVEGQDI